MLHDLATVHDDYARFEGREVTVRCRVIGEAHTGDRGGSKILFEVTDPRGNLDVETKLSFWLEEPAEPFEGLRRTNDAVLEGLSNAADGVPEFPPGETLLVRGIPNVSDMPAGRKLYVNVTSLVIREPDLRIGKSELRTQDACPRRYYLRYVKKVYYDGSPPNGWSFRGRVVHRALERALEDHLDRFVDDSWTEDDAIEFAHDVMNDDLALEQAKLIIAGANLTTFKEYAEEIIATLFTDGTFCTHVAGAETVQAERPLPNAYGYNGEVDAVLDGVPYDLKTTYNLDPDDREKHERQLKLYLFALLLERLEPGQDFFEELSDSSPGYIVYPNLEEEDGVRMDRIVLARDDVVSLVRERNEVAAARDTFAPPSPYGRDCEGCEYRTGTHVGATGETLPSACTFHCQNERRWPCYERTPDGIDSECSLFLADDCEQRFEFRDPAETDHYNALRAALREEREARETASELVRSVNRDILGSTGRLVTGLSLAGGSRDTLTYDPGESVVPAFSPGDTVVIEPAVDGVPGRAVPYLGRQDGCLVFGVDSHDPALMNPDVEYRAWYDFDPEAVSRSLLPYLDYAQRRQSARRFSHEETGSTEGLVEVEDVGDVVEHLDNEEVFVDIPARTDRAAVVGELVRELVTAPYPMPGRGSAREDGVSETDRTDETGDTVPEDDRRALILGTTPALVELAHRSTPDGTHYRMDAFSTGENAIHEDLWYHELQDRLTTARSIVSSVGYTVDTRVFHELVEHEKAGRTHTEKFFDVVVILGAERVTEPVYHYLADAADRVVTVGDRRAHGPEMVSTEARERGLHRSYYEWAHERYAAMPVEDAVSLQLNGEANAFIRELFPKDPFEPLDETIRFLPIEGGESVDVGEFTLHATVRARGVAHDLVFDASHTTANPFEVQGAFAAREYLDANALPPDGPVLIGDFPLELESKTPLEDTPDANHRVTIRADGDTIPAFARAFLYNRIEARIVAQVADEFDPDLVVTAFEAHANELQSRLEEQGIDVPVKLAREIDGTVASRAIVSVAAANNPGILHPPLTELETLYAMLSSAEDILIVGHEETLQSKDAIGKLVDGAEKYPNST